MQFVKRHDLTAFCRKAQVCDRKPDILAGVNDFTDPFVIIILHWLDYQNDSRIILHSRCQCIDKRTLLYQHAPINGNRFVIDDNCLDLIVYNPSQNAQCTSFPVSKKNRGRIPGSSNCPCGAYQEYPAFR